MPSSNIDLLLGNESLKKEFAIRGLDLEQVFPPVSDDLERENRYLENLLDWVIKYSECKSRKQMETEGYLYPPVDPGISPDNDWYKFELWMQGKLVRKKIRDLVCPYYTPPAPDNLTEAEIETELEKLTEVLLKSRITINNIYDIPARLIYIHILDCMDDDYEILNEGFWHLDGCTGYCPDCYQRPWCESGTTSCWQEDIDAGEMHLTYMVKHYVSPSPISLQILQECQEKFDKEYAEFTEQNKAIDENNFNLDDLPF